MRGFSSKTKIALFRCSKRILFLSLFFNVKEALCQFSQRNIYIWAPWNFLKMQTLMPMRQWARAHQNFGIEFLNYLTCSVRSKKIPHSTLMSNMQVWCMSNLVQVWCMSNMQVWCMYNLVQVWCMSNMQVWCMSKLVQVWCMSLLVQVWCKSHLVLVCCMSNLMQVCCMSDLVPMPRRGKAVMPPSSTWVR